MSPDCTSVPTLILTRPKAASLQFAKCFRGRIRIVISPLIEIENVAATYSPADAVIFSSRNAVEASQSAPKFVGRRAYCVGHVTAEAAQRAGYKVLGVAQTAAQLEHVIRTDAPQGVLLHLRGDVVAYPLAESLNRAGIVTNQAIVYQQSPQPLTEDARAALRAGGACIVPLFSPRTARLFAKAVHGQHVEAVVVAISSAVADACVGFTAKDLKIADVPDATSVRKLVEEALCRDESG